MPKYTRRAPRTARNTSAGSSRSPITTSAPAPRKAAARSSSRRTMARTASPRSSNSPVTVRPTPPSWPAAPVTRIGPLSVILLLPELVNWHELQRRQRSIPTVAAENSARVLPSHSMRPASAYHRKPPRRRSHSGRPQPMCTGAEEHSATEQRQEATGALLMADRPRSDRFPGCLAQLLVRWQSPHLQCTTTTKRRRHCRQLGTVAVAPAQQHHH